MGDAAKTTLNITMEILIQAQQAAVTASITATTMASSSSGGDSKVIPMLLRRALFFILLMIDKSLALSVSFVLHPAYDRQISCSLGEICPSSRL
ncbi:hypothetical protein [Neobacillus drentensis]|uniref:hypothetical protein n=1 Tax=Neobacillus drentensis TaxID=220684 RepID=UPI0030033EEA